MNGWIWYSFKYYYPKTRSLLLISILNIIRKGLSLLIPIIYGNIINILVGKQKVLLEYIVLLVVANMTSLFFSHIAKRIEIKLTRDINLDVKRNISSQLLTIPPYKLTRYNLGRIHSLLSTDSVAPTSVVMTLFNAGMAIIVVAGTIVTVFILNWKLSIVVLCTYPLTLLTNRFFANRIRNSAKNMSEKSDSMVGLIRKISGVLTEIHNDDGVERIYQEYMNHAKDNREAALDHFRLLEKNALSIKLISLLNYFMLTIGGVYLVVSGEMLLGTLFTFNTYAKNISSSLDAIAQVKANLQPAIVSVERLQEVEKLFWESVGDETHKIELNERISKVALKDIVVSYGAKPVLSRWSYTFTTGITGLRGGNGTGKTTIMRLILQNVLAQSGSIYFNNHLCSNVKKSSLHKKIAYVGNEKILFDIPIIDNILLFSDGSQINELEVNKVLGLLGLKKDIDKLPEGIHTVVSDKLKLSSGQIQKIQLARSLLRKPDILLLDEGFSNLDLESSQKVLSYLKESAKETIIILVSHRDCDYQYCDRMLSVYQGTNN